MADTKVTGAQSTPAFIEKLDIFSNKDQSKSVSIVNGTIQLMYYESILQDAVMANVTFADAGNSIDEKSSLEGLPIVGTEKVLFKIKDNNDVQIEFTFYVNKVTPIADQTTKGAVNLTLVSKEYILNDEVRVNKRFDGKVSDAVKTILTDFLETDKDISDIEDSTDLNEIPGQWKPIYTINWLSKKCGPANTTPGKTAGYFFYETSEGYHFKSIDTLLGQEKKKSIIYNETPDSRGANIPEGYDMKALTFSKDNRIDVQQKMEAGFQSTRIILFDPYTCKYEVLNPKATGEDGVEESLTKAGKELPVLNPEFNRQGENKQFSRTTCIVKDTGTLPSGTSQEQIQKSKDPNFKPELITNQAIMRYNQLYSSEIEITIPGDFSLHAGDAIHFDAPSAQKDTKNDDVDHQIGGLYIISALCHLVNAQGTYTKINLVRDSFGRTGKARKSDPQSGKPATPTETPGTQNQYQRTVSYASASTTKSF
jgi:hypothetical protein